MHSCTKGSSRINVEDHLVLIFCLHFFPGRYDQNVVYIELMEVLFPVIDPVLVLCLGFCDGCLSDIHKASQILQCSLHIFQDCLGIRILFQIEVQICDPVICWSLRHDIHKHLCLILIGQWLLILDFHTFNSHLGKCTDHNILCLCFCLKCKTVPFHLLYLLMLYTHLWIFIPVCRLFSIVPKTGTSFNIHEYRKKRKRHFVPLSCFHFIYSSNISFTFSRKPFFFFSVFSEVSDVLSSDGRFPHAASKASRAFFASSLRFVGVWTTSVT